MAKAKVLIVDDEEFYSRSLSWLLNDEGYDVRTAATGAAAIDEARQFGPDILVVDWILRGGIDGVEVARRLRAARPDIKTIFVTGYAGSELREHIGADLPATILEKPFGPEDLLSALRAG